MDGEDLRTQAELDQMLSENLDALDEWFEELEELSDGEGPITDQTASDLARMAAGTIMIVLGLRDFLDDELRGGYKDVNGHPPD